MCRTTLFKDIAMVITKIRHWLATKYKNTKLKTNKRVNKYDRNKNRVQSFNLFVWKSH